MDIFNSRLFRLFQPSKSVEELNQRIEDLRYTLNSVVQDIAVLKEILEEKGLMDAALYKRIRVNRMVQEHSSAGANSWRNSCFYPYTLDEEDFLQESLGANEAEVKSFQENVSTIETLT
jgi:hypothetical protein